MAVLPTFVEDEGDADDDDDDDDEGEVVVVNILPLFWQS